MLILVVTFVPLQKNTYYQSSGLITTLLTAMKVDHNETNNNKEADYTKNVSGITYHIQNTLWWRHNVEMTSWNFGQYAAFGKFYYLRMLCTLPFFINYAMTALFKYSITRKLLLSVLSWKKTFIQFHT